MATVASSTPDTDTEDTPGQSTEEDTLVMPMVVVVDTEADTGADMAVATGPFREEEREPKAVPMAGEHRLRGAPRGLLRSGDLTWVN